MDQTVVDGLRTRPIPHGGTVRVVRILLGASLFAAVILATVREWREVSETVAEIGPAPIIAALCLTLLGLVASAMTWRDALTELGPAVGVRAALKIYLVGQLGKYIPGSVWALVVQMELARAAAVRRAHAFAAGVLAVGINVLTGSALGLAVQPFVGQRSDWKYLVAGVGAVACAIVLAPPVLGPLANAALRLARQPRLARSPRWRGILRAVGFSTASWLLYGLALATLAIGAGADASAALLLALPAVALAMTVGFLVVISPSGIGVREAVLVAALAPILETGSALGVALVLRVVFTLADLAAASATISIRIAPMSAGTTLNPFPTPQPVSNE